MTDAHNILLANRLRNCAAELDNFAGRRSEGSERGKLAAIRDTLTNVAEELEGCYDTPPWSVGDGTTAIVPGTR